MGDGLALQWIFSLNCFEYFWQYMVWNIKLIILVSNMHIDGVLGISNQLWHPQLLTKIYSFWINFECPLFCVNVQFQEIRY